MPQLLGLGPRCFFAWVPRTPFGRTPWLFMTIMDVEFRLRSALLRNPGGGNRKIQGESSKFKRYVEGILPSCCLHTYLRIPLS